MSNVTIHGKTMRCAGENYVGPTEYDSLWFLVLVSCVVRFLEEKNHDTNNF